MLAATEPIGQECSAAVVGGCGAIGLEFVEAISGQVEVVAVDKDIDKVNRVNGGDLEKGALRATCDPSVVARVSVVVILVGTEGDDGTTRGSLDAAVEDIAPHLSDDQLLMIRSTVPPGSTRRIVQRLQSVYNVHCAVVSAPERALEGQVSSEFRTMPQLIGGPRQAMDRAEKFFRAAGASVQKLPTWEDAEFAKLICNAHRYASFQMANYFKAVAARAGADYDAIRAAVQLDYPRAAGLSSAGLIGGPCLPKDAAMLRAVTNDAFPSDPLGALLEFNAVYEQWVREQVSGWMRRNGYHLPGMVGLSFKPGVEDRRNSRGVVLARELGNEGISVVDLAEELVPADIDCVIDVFGDEVAEELLVRRGIADLPRFLVGEGRVR